MKRFATAAITALFLVGVFPSAASAQAAACPSFARNLYQGLSGTDVRELQLFLISQNLLSGDSATGYFGSLTEAAVRAFQRAHFVESTGYVGAFTRAAISAVCAAGYQGGQQSQTGSQQGNTTAAPTCSVIVSNAAPKTGESFTVQWTSQNAQYMTGLAGTGQFPASGSQTLSEAAPGIRTYTLSFTGPGGSATCQASITVTSSTASDLVASPSSGTAPLAVNFTLANPQSGVSYFLDFGDGNSGSTAFGGSGSHTYAAAGTYTARLSTANSTVATRTITVTAAQQSATPTCTLRASPTSIAAGGSTTLTWSSTNATGATITGGVGTVSASGSSTVTPSQTTTYIAVFNGTGGSVACDATVTVGPAAQTSGSGAGLLCGSRVVTAKSPTGQSMIYGDEQISTASLPAGLGYTLKRTEGSYKIYANAYGSANIPCEGKEITVNPQIGVKNVVGSINCPSGYGGFMLASFIGSVDPVSGYQVASGGTILSPIVGEDSSRAYLISCVKGIFPPSAPACNNPMGVVENGCR